MKFLILIFAFLTVISVQAQSDDSVNNDDPNMSLYTGELAASAVDTTGTHESTVRENYKIPVTKSCPACNLHGSINLVDENAGPASSESSSGSQSSEGSGTQGP